MALSGVLFLGSVPLGTTEEVFNIISEALPGRIHSLPDGEPAARGNFIAWQHPVFPINVVQPRWGGQPPKEKQDFNYSVSDLNPTGYDDRALESYALFQEHQNASKILEDVRFQVSIPSPLGVIRGFVETDYCAEIEPLYEALLLRALRRIQDSIPHSKLMIQWDLPFEIGMLEHERGRIQDPYHAAYFSPVRPGILDRLARLASAVDDDVEMGYHLCYGDLGHVHFVQPESMAVAVDLATSIIEKITPVHTITYFHLPVPKNRDDPAYYQPLAQLKLGQETKLYLGLVHPNDEEGTRARIEAARAAFPYSFGVATECGLGRTPSEELRSVLDICAHVT